MKDVHGNEVQMPVMKGIHGNPIMKAAEKVEEEAAHAGEGIRNFFGAAFEHHKPADDAPAAQAEEPAKATVAPEVKTTVELPAATSEAPKE